MAARRSNQPPQDISLFVVVAGALGAGVAAWYGWPGIPVVWLSVLAASWMVQSPQLTGKKDSAGYPAPANPAEERKVSRYQASKELRTSLLFPLRDLLPGKPVRAAWISAVIVAWIAYLVPVIGNHHMASGNATALDALATLWLTLATTGAFRRAKGVDNPGVRVDTWRTYRAGHRRAFVAIIAVLGAISGVVFAVALISLDARFGRGFGTATLAPRGARHPGLFIADPDIAIATLAGAGAWFAVLVSWRRTAISEYSDLVNARAQWKYRWMSLKYDPTPTVVKHEVRDGVVIDTLDAPAHLGAIEFLRNEQKLAPLMGPGERVALLSVPEDGPLGPVPGTRSATRFLTATWSSSYDITGTGADVELVTLWAQSVLAWVGRSVGVPLEPMPNEVVSVTSFVDESPDVTTALDAKTGTGMIDRVSRFWQAVREPAPTTSTLDVAASREDSGSVDTDDGDVAGSAHPQSLLWRTTWYYSDDTIGPQVFRDAHLATLESAMRAGVLIDHRDGGTMFLGDAGAAQDDENTERALTKVRTEDLWRQVWTSSVKMGANLPVPQIATHAERPLASGATVHRMAFALNLGNSPLDYKYAGVENKLKSALGMGRTSGASFVAVTGFPDSRNGGRPGDRHPQAIYVIWSFDAVPRTPTAIAPSSPADVWMLAGIINDAFTNVKLEHPEIVSARCLTKPHSRSHAWEIQLRLYGGVTTGMVRSAAGKIADNLATPWVRVADADDGCVLYVGEAPDDANFAQRGDAALVAALDWEQAFLVSHVVGSVGSVPRLVSSNEMPSNSNVKVLEFELPPGLDKASLKAATGKLRTATGNAYISVLDSPKGPTFVTIQASRENPLPNTVPFDFAAADRADGMAFATGVDGEPVEFIPKIDVHAAIIGMSGSGKDQPLTERIPVPLSKKFPSGWATIGELTVGDEVFAVDGKPTKVISLSPVAERQVHTLHFSDGQTVNCGPDHLWKVSSRSSRATQWSKLVERRESHRSAYEARVRNLRAIAQQMGAGAVATTKDLSAMTGESIALLQRILPVGLACAAMVPTAKATRRFNVSEFIGNAPEINVLNRKWSREEMTSLLSSDEWMSVREITMCLLGRDGSRPERRSVAQRKDSLRPRFLESTGMWTTDLYPVDETLTLLADYIEQRSKTDKRGRKVKPLETIITAAEMKKSVDTDRWSVKVAAPLNLPEQNLPLDPYVLGVWLGDGHTRNPAVTSADPEIIEHIVSAGYPVNRTEYRTDQGAATTYYFGASMRSALRSCGYTMLNRKNDVKHIPALYLRSSRDQRLALLQGLMDTDGTVDKNGSCELCLCDEMLVYDSLELIRSLGIKASISSSDATITEVDPENPGKKRRRVTGTRWRIHFTTTEKVFRLARKAERLPESVRDTQGKRYVTNITTGDVVPMRCISIDHPEHLYLSDGFVPTHNSVTAQALLYGAAIKGSEIYVIDPSKGAADFKFLAPFARVMATTIHAAAATLKAIYAEVERRKDLNAHYGTASITDLPDDVRPSPMFVFIDEFTSLITSEKVPRQPFDDPELEAERQTQLRISNDRMAIAYYTGKLAREARSAGVSLSLGTQKLMADSLKAVPGAADLKTNLSRILLGSTSQGERMSALRAFDQAPDPGETVPIGRGIWESSTKTGVLIQAWYAPASQLGEELAERVEPLDASQRLDITPFLSREIEQFGAFEPDGADRVIDLGEISFTLDDLESVDRPEVVDEVEDEVPDPWRIDWGVPPQVAVAAAADLDDDPFALPPPKPKRELALKPDDDPFA